MVHFAVCGASGEPQGRLCIHASGCLYSNEPDEWITTAYMHINNNFFFCFSLLGKRVVCT